MIPPGDPHPQALRPQRFLWGARNQIYRDNHPRAYTLRFSGLLFLLLGATALIAFVTAGRPWQLSVVIAVILLAVFTIPMALIIVFSSPARVTERARHDPGFTRFPADTDPAKLAEAWRLVRQGRLGPDPETNRLGRIVVAKELSNKSTASSFALIGMAALLNAFLGISRLLMEGVSPLVVALLGLAILLSGLSVSVLFLAPRQRRRSEAFRDAYDDAYGEASGNAA
ncbi:hypothetical protein [Nocardiopsis tropica]|uniref:Uncharacterized protein n=1 Tax=Nocardiopsis tropica TaxID=109330 RepID=A0ABU7KP51_9ACTN|nr:hypothetical protein [Nocardiopsis umidischolae]MEE2050457.1 hypothetical protein [Nocardiopsis umidischolae]